MDTHLCAVFADIQLKKAKAYGWQQLEKPASLGFESNCAVLQYCLSRTKTLSGWIGDFEYFPRPSENLAC